MAKVGEFGEQQITSGALAAMLGKSSQWIRELTRQGVLKKLPNGKYRLDETVQAYIEHITGAGADDKAPKKSDYDREIAEINRDKKRIELEEMRGNLHHSDDVRRVMGEMIHTSKSKVLALPSRVAPRLAGEPSSVIEKVLIAEISAALSSLTEYSPDLFNGKGAADDGSAYDSEED